MHWPCCGLVLLRGDFKLVFIYHRSGEQIFDSVGRPDDRACSFGEK